MADNPLIPDNPLPAWLTPPLNLPPDTSVVDTLTGEIHKVVDSSGDLIILKNSKGDEIGIGIDVFQKEFRISGTF